MAVVGDGEPSGPCDFAEDVDVVDVLPDDDDVSVFDDEAVVCLGGGSVEEVYAADEAFAEDEDFGEGSAAGDASGGDDGGVEVFSVFEGVPAGGVDFSADQCLDGAWFFDGDGVSGLEDEAGGFFVEPPGESEEVGASADGDDDAVEDGVGEFEASGVGDGLGEGRSLGDGAFAGLFEPSDHPDAEGRPAGDDDHVCWPEGPGPGAGGFEEVGELDGLNEFTVAVDGDLLGAGFLEGEAAEDPSEVEPGGVADPSFGDGGSDDEDEGGGLLDEGEGDDGVCDEAFEVLGDSGFGLGEGEVLDLDPSEPSAGDGAVAGDGEFGGVVGEPDDIEFEAVADLDAGGRLVGLGGRWLEGVREQQRGAHARQHGGQCTWKHDLGSPVAAVVVGSDLDSSGLPALAGGG